MHCGLSLPACVVLALSGLATPLAAEDEVHDWGFHDLRLMFAASPAPEVRERVKSPSTPKTHTDYDWQRQHSHGFQAAAGWYAARLTEFGGLVWGGNVVGATYDTTPSYYTVNGAAFRPGGSSLHYYSGGITGFAGYGYRTDPDPEEFAGYLEIGPFLGGGAAWANTENQNPSGGFDRKGGWGGYYELGAAASAFVTERELAVGATLFYASGFGVVNVKMPDGDKSKLKFSRHGFGFGAEIAYRY